MSKLMEKIENNPELIIKAVITVNMALFAVAVLISGNRLYLGMNPFGFMGIPTPVLVKLGATGAWVTSSNKMWWTFLSAGYNHANLLHIVFNMIAFMALGRLVSSLYGSYAMFSVYSLSTITGFFISSVAGIYVTVGASAGICGLIGASIIYGLVSRDPFAVIIKQQTSGWIISLVLMGLMIPGINNWGHAGGFIGGAVSGYLVMKTTHVRGFAGIHAFIAFFFAVLTILAIGMALFNGFLNTQT